MQTVSDSWKAIHERQLLNKSYVRVSLGIGDPEALEDASASDNGSVYISNTAETVNSSVRYATKYATLEENIWLLDGESEFIPTSGYGNDGYIGSATSGLSRGYEEYTPYIDIEFSEEHTIPIPGITIVWGDAYGEYATAFKITVYSGGLPVQEIQVNDNDSVRSLVNFEIDTYNKIRIEILQWCLPNHRPRIFEIYVGLKKVYENEGILNFTHNMEISPVGATTPINKISFSVDNSDRIYDPNNNTGLAKYFMERQEVNVEYGLKNDLGKIEWIPGGVFFLSEWDAPQNGLKANFGARDLLEFMRKTYTKGVFVTSENMYNLAEAVLREADLPHNRDGSDRWILSPVLQNTFTSAPLPFVSIAECLQYIAQASRCVLYCDRNGFLRIEPAPDYVTDYKISRFNAYQLPETSLQKALKSIDTKVYSYFVGESGKELFKGSVNITGTHTVVIKYSQPAVMVTATVSNGILESAEYYTSACYLNITGYGNITITVTGDTLVSSDSSYITDVGAVGEEQGIDNPLITSTETAEAVNEWVESWLANRRTISVSDWRADTRLDATDIVTIANKFSEDNVMMTSVKYVFNGAFHASGEGRVIENG